MGWLWELREPFTVALVVAGVRRSRVCVLGRSKIPNVWQKNKQASAPQVTYSYVHDTRDVYRQHKRGPLGPISQSTRAN